LLHLAGHKFASRPDFQTVSEEKFCEVRCKDEVPEPFSLLEKPRANPSKTYAASVETMLRAVGVVNHEKPPAIRLITHHVRRPASQLYGASIGVGGR
jgi:hypothetical protein